MAAPRRVVTEGIVVRPFYPGISHKTVAYKAHRADCRYAKPDMYPMAEIIEVHGHDRIRTKIVVGVVEPCKTCNPVLLAPGEEQ